MRGKRLLAWLCVGFVVGLMLAPTTALARPGGRGGGGGRGHGGHHHGGHRGGHHHGHGFHNGGHGHKGFHGGHGHKGFHNGFGHGQKSFHVNFFDNGHHKGHHFKGHHHGKFFSSCCAGVVYAAPVVDYPPVVSYSVDAPVYATTYQAPPVYSPAPMVGAGSVTLAPATPSVVEYPHGRYDLRGDGVTAPYQWVWIPNPPPAPPPAAPAPPAVTPPATPPAAPPPASDAPRSKLYRWTDDLGVTHWTNRADNVPAEHRKLAAPATQP